MSAWAEFFKELFAGETAFAIGLFVGLLGGGYGMMYAYRWTMKFLRGDE